MFAYRIFGTYLVSEFEIKILSPAEPCFNLEEAVKLTERDVEAEVLSILAEHQEDYYYVDYNVSAFFNKAGFYLIRGGKEIQIKIKNGYDHETIVPWLLGFCLSIALLQREIMTVHCSALEAGDGAILISGRSGAGKSSLAGKLLECGCKLMADDAAAVRCVNDKCMVFPAFPYQKLCANEVEKRKLNKADLYYIDEDKDKYLVPAGVNYEPDPQPLKYFFYIVKAPIEELRIQRISGFDSFMTVKNNLFLNCLHGDWATNPCVINQCMNIASKCIVYLIARPEEKDTLEEMTERVMNIIESNE